MGAIWEHRILNDFGTYIVDSSGLEIWQESDCMQSLNTQGDVDNWNKDLKEPNNWSWFEVCLIQGGLYKTHVSCFRQSALVSTG